MSLVDEAVIHAEAGNGGDGVIRWLRTKTNARGGPDVRRTRAGRRHAQVVVRFSNDAGGETIAVSANLIVVEF